MQRICVFGAGAVGGHMAARLARAGLNVSVVVRGGQLDAIRRNGLRFVSPTEDFTVRVRASADGRELGPQDLVISAVKAHALPGSVESLKGLLAPNTPILFAVNGIPWWYFYRGCEARADPRLARLDPGGRLWTEVGARRAIGCVIRSPNEVTAPGVVRAVHDQNYFEVGEPDETASPRLSAIVAALQPGLPGVVAKTDIRRALWNKLMLNIASSPITALVGAPWADFHENAEMVALFCRIFNEGAEVARAWGVTIDVEADAILAAIGGMRHPPSMLQDLRAGRPLEIDAQQYAVQDLARAAGVHTPALDMLTALLAQRAKFAGNPRTRVTSS